MARSSNNGFQLEWFTVTYRSVFAAVLVVVLLAIGGPSYWYYSRVLRPRAAAEEAVVRAERGLDAASAAGSEPATAEIVEGATLNLREAREAFRGRRWDDARVAAIRAENLALKALRMIEGENAEALPVRFYRVEGDVRVKRSGEFSWKAANSKMILKVGDQVKTASNASAQLIYFDGAVTTIQSGSLLEIRDLYEDPVTKVRRVREKLTFGEVNASTQESNVKGSYHEVTTEKVAARSSEASEFRVAIDETSKTSEYDVFKGSVVVATPQRKENLVAGEGIRAGSSGELAAKRALPQVPRLVAPRDQRVFIFDEPGTEKVTLNWELVAGAATYHLVISDKSLFTDSLYDANRSGSSAVLDGVPAGSYFWKVAAITESGKRGPFSKPRRFRVSSQKIRDRADEVPPALEITEFVPVGLMVIVNGRTEPGATLWADNEKVDVYDDGTFYAVLRLRKEGVNKLRFVSQDTAGNETELIKSTYVEIY